MDDSTLPPAGSPGPVPTVSIASVGCKANREEMECLVSRLVDAGFRQVPFGSPADVTVVNTCTVTAAGDADSRKLVRRGVAGTGRLIVTGCLAQRAPGAVAGIEGVHLVLGNAEKAGLAERIVREEGGPHSAPAPADPAPAPASPEPATPEQASGVGPPGPATRGARVEVGADPTLPSFPAHGRARAGRRTRGVLKVQDGCDGSCGYCIVPSVRGASRSRPLDDCLSQVALLAGAGHREIVLTGINTAAWGRDLPGRPELPDLVDALVTVPGVARVRLSSLEPGELKEGWLERFAACPRLCRHFHLSLQSADPEVLARMGRSAPDGGPASLVADIHRLLPGSAVGCDLVVGLPGETPEAFARTLRFVEESPLAYLHVFAFSPRPGTPAAEMGDAPPEPVRRDRSARLRAAGARRRALFASSLVGTVQEVLPERPSGAGRGQGLSGNYLRLRFPWDGMPVGGAGLLRVRVVGVAADGSAEGIVVGKDPA
jgi:threonylcarbamoyladenosine tRNA methylthiotransferase MtaB